MPGSLVSFQDYLDISTSFEEELADLDDVICTLCERYESVLFFFIFKSPYCGLIPYPQG